MDIGGYVRAAIQRNDACVVNHLIKNHDIAGSLNDLVSVVIARRKRACGNASRYAAIPDAHVLIRIGVVRGIVISSRLGRGSERNAASRRVHHERSLPGGYDFGSGVEPNLVVAAYVARLG